MRHLFDNTHRSPESVHTASSFPKTMPPPPIPQRKEAAVDVPNEGSNPPPIPARNSPRRRPAGAVATAMVSGQQGGGLPSVGQQVAPKEDVEEQEQEQEHANNPYDLKAMPGSSVTASYPFRGDEDLQQMSFSVGDVIKVKQKEEMWSWGVLERSGKEGWFPHNYVGTTFKPLPGIHEMAAKIRERRERLDAAEAQAANPNPAAAGDQSASDVQVGLAETADAAPGGATTVAGGATSEEAQSLSKEAPPSGAEGSTDPGAAGPMADDGAAAQLGEVVLGEGDGDGDANAALGGGVAGAGGGEESGSSSADPSSKEGAAAAAGAGAAAGAPPAAASSKSASLEPQISSAPSLPPFFKAAPAADEVATAVAPPATGTVGEASAAEVVDGTQIDGVGFAGQAGAASTGCKCSIM